MKELALQNTRLDSRYDAMRLLGRGSYAEIYLARDNHAPADSLHKFVVIKALNVFLQEAPDPELERTLVENFQNEALALDRVRHQNVINRLGHGTARDLQGTIFHYLILEYLPGGNLAELCNNRPLAFEKTLFYLEQVCAGLEHAHQKNVIHRDIKPQNLLLTEDREIVKIADFGVARFAELDSPITRVGTNIYAAPEHSPLAATANLSIGNGKMRLTPAADVYSLAKTVYVLLGGESPRRFANAPVESLPAQVAAKAWSNEVLRVLRRATQTDPAQRQQTVGEFWRDFLAIKDKINAAQNLELAVDLSASMSGARGFSPFAPARPSFSSMKNVQTMPLRSEELPERPRIVVSLKDKETVSKISHADLPHKSAETSVEALDGDARRARQKIVRENRSNKIKAQHEFDSSSSQKSNRGFGFVKSVLVAALLVGMFGAVLYGTFNYLAGSAPTVSWASIFGDPAVGRQGNINQTANLRSAAGASNDDIGDVPANSIVKVLSVKDNWYEVQIVRRSRPKDRPEDADRGWVNKRYVDLQ